MKLKYWMAIYPFHMSGDAQFKPMPSMHPLSEVGQGAKLVSFTVEVPDDLFGAVELPAVLDAPIDTRKE